MKDNTIKGRFLYRDGIDAILPLFFCFIIHKDTTIFLIKVNGKLLPPVLYCSPVILLHLLSIIPVFISLKEMVLEKRTCLFFVKKYDLHNPSTIFYLSTLWGDAFLIERKGGRRIAECRSLLGVFIYLISNLKNYLLIPFRKEKKDEFWTFFEEFSDQIIVVNGGFFKLISTADIDS